jgi:calcineurin-like phosphoesterase family protein
MAELLSDHLAGLIDNLSNFRNTVDSDKRQNLFNALRAAQQEASTKGVVMPENASPAEIASQIGQLKAGDAVAEAMGIREIAGSGKYEEFDPQWVESALNYYKTGHNRTPFPRHDDPKKPVEPLQTIVAEPEIRIAIAGDWGTGEDAAKAVAAQMAKFDPHYTIHLGDVYYSGLKTEEQAKFVDLWPAGSVGSYTLNSNHEMYCGGDGFFNVLLSNPKFNAQHGLSYFALANDDWLIIGLDTAYFAYYQSLLYEQGSLSEPDTRKEPAGMVQQDWLRGVLRAHPNKRVIILTHHDGFDIHPITAKVTRKPLYQQVTGQLANVHDWWWYWGHVHGVLVYRRIFFPTNAGLTPRCVGHGAIPYLPVPPDLSRLTDGTVAVEWAETDLANHGGDARRAPNGFLMLRLTGAELREQMYDESGRLRWSNF